MTHLNRVKVQWTGFPGAPGTSTFYFLDMATSLASLETLFTAIAPAIPTDVHIQMPVEGDIIEDTTGDVVDSWGGDATSEVTGSGYATYAAPLGLVMHWHTGAIMDGHRVRGRTFLVPVSGGSFTSSGSPGDGTTGPIAAAGNEFIIEQSASFVIWHRPYAGREATAKLKAKAAHLGGHALVTACSVPDLAAVLRSRRD